MSAVVVVMALVSVVLTELTGVALMGFLPASVDLNDNLYALALPSVTVAILVSTAVLFAIHRRQPAIFPLLYSVVFLAALAFELYAFFNPVTDILKYLSSALVVAGIVFWLCRKRFWLRANSGL